jgi:hypothetical protein
MGHAYTPGLKVTEKVLLTKKRILPLKGDVLSKVGDKVKPDTVVARTLLPGNVQPINVANILGIPPEDIMHHMLRRGEGQRGRGYRQEQELLWSILIRMQSQGRRKRGKHLLHHRAGFDQGESYSGGDKGIPRG